MSSDNGVYILKTRTESGYEYRVAHLGAIDNLGYGCDTPDCIMKIARKMWGYNGNVFTDRGKALEIAHDLADTIEILEYGVSTIDLSSSEYPEFVEIDLNAEKPYEFDYLDTAGQSQE